MAESESGAYSFPELPSQTLVFCFYFFVVNKLNYKILLVCFKYECSKENHTWNRVYYNGRWWDMDLTNDTLATKENRKTYSFRELESISSPDKDYHIMKIY